MTRFTSVLTAALVIGTMMTAAPPASADLPGLETRVAPHAAQVFARSRVRLARRIERHDEWLREKHARRRRIRERREAAAAAAEAAAEAAAPTPTPAPTPTASYSTTSTGWTMSEAEAASYLRVAGFPETVIPEMVEIEKRESNLCPTAVYGYGCAGEGHAYAGGPACGAAQLFPCPGPEALDPAINAQYAYAKYQASGLAPWGM